MIRLEEDGKDGKMGRYLTSDCFLTIKKLKLGEMDIRTAKEIESFKDFLEEIRFVQIAISVSNNNLLFCFRYVTSRSPKEVESNMIHHLSKLEHKINKIEVPQLSSDEELNSVSEVNSKIYRSNSPSARSILSASTAVKRKADEPVSGINLMRKFK